jgi:hypothetical protein
VNGGTKLDIRLVRAMRRGAAELPDDLDVLRRYLGTIALLLAEKAADLEPTWDEACAAAAETATLLNLQATVTERAIAVPARSLSEVRTKLAIWRTIGPEAEDGDVCGPRTRLILSVEADLARLSASSPRAPQGAD